LRGDEGGGGGGYEDAGVGGEGVMFLGERIAWEDKKPHHLTRVI